MILLIVLIVIAALAVCGLPRAYRSRSFPLYAILFAITLLAGAAIGLYIGSGHPIAHHLAGGAWN